MVDFLGLDFCDADLAGLRRTLAQRVSAPGYGYVVTPNVDHVVAYHRSLDDRLREAYDGAALKICDSRILAALARPMGRRLHPVPGSDLTLDLIRAPLGAGIRMAVIGPDRAAFETLSQRFPDADLVFVPSADRLVPGSREWHETVARTAGLEWDLLFVCLSFPKQEFFAQDLGRAGRDHGVALCVGASVDFLTGKQVRAPVVFQRLGLEWLHRLGSDPRRLWRRYILRGPVVFSLAARQWLSDRRGIPFQTLPHERAGGECGRP